MALISLAIPLENNLITSQYELLGLGEGETEHCPGTVTKPTAAPGWGCVYTFDATEETELFAVLPSATAGGFIRLTTPPGGGMAYGTWAVTAP
ncbi:MAG TPA: hypothetical protein VHQ43_04505 [Solirubrobacterales bacterium]|jgi:hypothetical protein|nr:hypothetical protein [Solirubrobacterales bacterium]